jgi:hypothetical protein
MRTYRARRLQWIVCVLLPLAILAPLCLALGASTEDYCACGMKKGECFCDLAAHRKMGHCDTEVVERRCALHAPRPMESEGPRISLDLRNHIGIFESQVPGIGAEPNGFAERAEAFFPLTVSAPPESPPPRASFSLS